MSSSSFLDRFHFGQHHPFSWENLPASVAGVVTVLGGGDWGAAGVDGVAVWDGKINIPFSICKSTSSKHKVHVPFFFTGLGAQLCPQKIIKALPFLDWKITDIVELISPTCQSIIYVHRADTVSYQNIH